MTEFVVTLTIRTHWPALRGEMRDYIERKLIENEGVESVTVAAVNE